MCLHLPAFTGRGDPKFEIIDDGAGFKVEELTREDIPSRYKGGGYGIRNVNERICLEYDSERGVTIKSTIGQGTTCIVTVKI
jgi:two-component system sensor histidine kinase YesM